MAAVNDGHLVAKLRKGRSVTLKTADRVRAYMASRAQRQPAGAPHGSNPRPIACC